LVLLQHGGDDLLECRQSIAKALLGRTDIEAEARWPRRLQVRNRGGDRVQRPSQLTRDLADQVALGENLPGSDIEQAGRALLQQVERRLGDRADVDA
jgi:hypothetical protein